ncbi:hypothetical protein ABZV93_15825 [Actinopolymorpha sp. NPDC004070]|uniref:hypothetical protein n=1 Tax=Actinopolymorpha sp. NPDC004070 TaxID=3154548 RepID=UPI0033B3B4A1
MSESSTEPMQPSLLLKKKNMAYLSGREVGAKRLGYLLRRGVPTTIHPPVAASGG